MGAGMGPLLRGGDNEQPRASPQLLCPKEVGISQVKSQTSPASFNTEIAFYILVSLSVCLIPSGVDKPFSSSLSRLCISTHPHTDTGFLFGGKVQSCFAEWTSPDVAKFAAHEMF